jgi:hypothetical protein
VFSNPIQGILDIAGKIGGAVSLFDPSTMMRFGMVMREVTAVIGMGLTPVMQTITSLIKEFGDYLKPVVQDLGGEFAAAIRELGKELKPLVKLLIVELRNSLQDFTDKLKQLNKQGNLDIGGVANELGAGPRQVNQRRLAIAGGGALAGAGIGAFAGPPGALIGGGIGGLVGMLGADQLAPQWPGKRANGQELMAAANNLKKGQLMGTAVAHNATIGSGADLARRAAQDAFIASSNNGLAEGKNLFEVAAQKAIDFFNKNNQPPVVNGNAQPGVANGQGPIAQAGDLWAAFGGAAKAQLGFK